jgi:hypothetical protein
MSCTRLPKAAGLSNFASYIADHGYRPRQEFLIPSAPAEAFDVVANPCFRLAPPFVERALTLGAVKTTIMFPTARLNAVRWLQPLSLAKIYLLTPRPSMPPATFIAPGEKPEAARSISVGCFELGYCGAFDGALAAGRRSNNI